MRELARFRDAAENKLDLVRMDDGRLYLVHLTRKEHNLSKPLDSPVADIMAGVTAEGWRLVATYPDEPSPRETSEQKRAAWVAGIAREMPKKDADAWIRGLPRPQGVS